MKLSIVLLSLCISADALHARADMRRSTKTAFAIGAACLAGIGIFSLISIYRLTDKQLLTKGEELLVRCDDSKYKASLLGLFPPPDIATVSEEFLTALADYYHILEEITLVVSLLKNHSELLIKATLRLAAKTDSASESIAAAVKKQQRLILDSRADLDGAAQLHDLHRDYFSLISVIRDLRTNYRKELAVVENQTFDYGKTKKKMAKAVMKKYRLKAYPFVSYIEQINQDRLLLKEQVSTCSRYRSLALQTNELLDKLYTISKIVQANQNYSREMQEQKKNDEADQLRAALDHGHRSGFLPTFPLFIGDLNGKEKM